MDKIVNEFYQTKYDEHGKKIEDIGFLKFVDGTIKKFWEWHNTGKEIIVIQHRNRNRQGNFYRTEKHYAI